MSPRCVMIDNEKESNVVLGGGYKSR